MLPFWMGGFDLNEVFLFTILVEKWKQMLLNYYREFYLEFPTVKEKLKGHVTCDFFFFWMEFSAFSFYKK